MKQIESLMLREVKKHPMFQEMTPAEMKKEAQALARMVMAEAEVIKGTYGASQSEAISEATRVILAAELSR